MIPLGDDTRTNPAIEAHTDPFTARVAAAKRLARRSPKTGRRHSLRAIADELAALGHLGQSGKPYFAGSIALMIQGHARCQHGSMGRSGSPQR